MAHPGFRRPTPPRVPEGDFMRTDVLTDESVLQAVPKGLLIGGEWRAAEAGARFTGENPATGLPLCEAADASATDALLALAAADDAQADWAAHSPRHRADLLWAVHAAMLAERDGLATLIALDTGKPWVEAQAEVAYAA